MGSIRPCENKLVANWLRSNRPDKEFDIKSTLKTAKQSHFHIEKPYASLFQEVKLIGLPPLENIFQQINSEICENIRLSIKLVLDFKGKTWRK